MLTYGYFRLARRAFLESNCSIKVGAVLCNRKPLSFGFNKDKTHPLYANPSNTLKISIHAEMDCISGLSYEDLRGSVLYIYRELKDGTPAIARPCNDCMNVLRETGISKIIYTVNYFPFYRIERLS